MELGSSNTVADCKVGVRYEDEMSDGKLPCFEGHGTCPSREYTTDQELDKELEERARFWAKIKEGVSPCCDAPINNLKGIPDGPHKGHGARHCTKCGACLFIV